MTSPVKAEVKDHPPWRLANLARYGRYVAPTVECVEPGCSTPILKSEQAHGRVRCREHARPGRDRLPRWTLVCTECGDVREYRPTQFRYDRDRGRHPTAVIDESAGKGTYICGPCKQAVIAWASPVGRRIAYLRKKGGRARLARRAADLRAQITLEQLQTGRDKAAATNRGRIPTSEELRRRSWSHIAPRPVGRFGLCRICGFLAYSAGPDRAEMHKGCLSSWRRGRHLAFHQYPPRARGNRLSSELLGDTFEIAVRHLLRGEPISRLAAEFDLGKDTAQDRIDTLIKKRLPTDGRGGKRLVLWSDTLHKAYAQRRKTL